jgi:cysteinyl-tRNA synthetase
MKAANEVIAVIDFSDEKIDSGIMKLIEKRQDFRAKKMFKESDEIRADLLKKGIQLDDSATGVVWKKLK